VCVRARDNISQPHGGHKRGAVVGRAILTRARPDIDDYQAVHAQPRRFVICVDPWGAETRLSCGGELVFMDEAAE
jgi:hypothetical protein